MSFTHSGKSKSEIIKDIFGDNCRLLHAAFKYPLWQLKKFFQDEVIMNTKQGRLKFSLRDQVIGRCLYMFKQYEYDSSRRCIQFLINEKYLTKKPIHFYDVGANIGLISIGLMLDGLIDQATAIEPEPYNFSLLKENIALNGLEEKINAVECALGTKEETTNLILSDSNYGGHSIGAESSANNKPSIKIKSFPLDRFVHIHEKPSVIWIDIEGFEGYVFKSGQSILSEGIPTISEISPHTIERSGLTLSEYTSIVQQYWSYYWVDRGGKFIKYSIKEIQSLYDEVGSNSEDYDNIIFTR